MNKLKSSYICSYCSKIYKDPVELPCGDLICEEHLNEEKLLKNNFEKLLHLNKLTLSGMNMLNIISQFEFSIKKDTVIVLFLAKRPKFSIFAF